MNNPPPPLWEGKGEGEVRIAVTSIARKLRSNSTEAERRLWQTLRSEGLGVKFRRQAVIGQYIVDFVCFEKKLVVEVDGGQHCHSQEDSARDEWLNNQGFVVLRFWNNEVVENLDGVAQKIRECLNSPLLISLHEGGEYYK